MLADYVTMNRAGRQIQLFAKHVAKTSGIQDGAGTDDTISRKSTNRPSDMC